jgi:hypothetical protein
MQAQAEYMQNRCWPEQYYEQNARTMVLKA